MKGRASWRAILLGVLLLAAGGRGASALSDPAEMLANPKLEARAEHIGRQLRCLVCQNESIEASDAGLAKDLRRIVRQQVLAGRTDKQIIAWMVGRYGDFVRLRPPFEPSTWLLWFSPLLALGGGGLIALFARRTHPAAPQPLDPAERERLAHLLDT